MAAAKEKGKVALGPRRDLDGGLYALLDEVGGVRRENTQKTKEVLIGGAEEVEYEVVGEESAINVWGSADTKPQPGDRPGAVSRERKLMSILKQEGRGAGEGAAQAQGPGGAQDPAADKKNPVFYGDVMSRVDWSTPLGELIGAQDDSVSQTESSGSSLLTGGSSSSSVARSPVSRKEAPAAAPAPAPPMAVIAHVSVPAGMEPGRGAPQQPKEPPQPAAYDPGAIAEARRARMRVTSPDAGRVTIMPPTPESVSTPDKPRSEHSLGSDERFAAANELDAAMLLGSEDAETLGEQNELEEKELSNSRSAPPPAPQGAVYPEVQAEALVSPALDDGFVEMGDSSKSASILGEIEAAEEAIPEIEAIAAGTTTSAPTSQERTGAEVRSRPAPPGRASRGGRGQPQPPGQTGNIIVPNIPPMPPASQFRDRKISPPPRRELDGSPSSALVRSML